MERRFHSPYKYWVSGLLFELLVLVGFVAVLVAVSLLVVRLVG